MSRPLMSVRDGEINQPSFLWRSWRSRERNKNIYKEFISRGKIRIECSTGLIMTRVKRNVYRSQKVQMEGQMHVNIPWLVYSTQILYVFPESLPRVLHSLLVILRLSCWAVPPLPNLLMEHGVWLPERPQVLQPKPSEKLTSQRLNLEQWETRSQREFNT